MIDELQRGARDAVSTMERGRDQVQDGVAKAVEAGESLESITRVVGEITSANGQMADAVVEQGRTAEDIDRNITRISDVARETVDSTHGLIQATQELENLAGELQQIAGQFRV